jgi:heme/copper-type cytochrome/quinol oxidase subunit 3
MSRSAAATDALDPRDLDASTLPSFRFGDASPMWWGTLGVIAIEGMVFALAIVVYFYVRTRVDAWPPEAPPPDLAWGAVNTLVMLASLVPNQLTKRAAERQDLAAVRLWIVVCLVFALAFLGVRALEFTTLNCRWDQNAYGSAVWLLLGLHTTHLVTDTVDSAVLAALMFTGPLEGRRFVDVSENAFYWYFVVGAWLPIAATIYLAPRLLP